MKKISLLFLVSLLALAALASGCENQYYATKESLPAATEDASIITLAPWTGSWNNLAAYMDSPTEENSPTEKAASYQKKRQCDIDGMKIAADTVTFLDDVTQNNGNIITTTPYVYVATHHCMFGDDEFIWYEFQAQEAKAPYPVLLLMAVEEHGPFSSFQFRYGADIESLLADEDWLPMMVDADAHKADIKAKISADTT